MTRITLPSRELYGMLLDIEKSMANDETLPMISCLVLHTGGGHLYASSTDRWVFAQARAQFEGDPLAPLYLPREDVVQLLAYLRLSQRRNYAMVSFQLAEDGTEIAFSVDDRRGLVCHHEPDTPFPALHTVTTAISHEPTGTEAFLSAELLHRFTAIGRRRRRGIRIMLADGTRPSQVIVGPHYRAVLMPMAHADEPMEWNLPGSAQPVDPYDRALAEIRDLQRALNLIYYRIGTWRDFRLPKTVEGRMDDLQGQLLHALRKGAAHAFGDLIDPDRQEWLRHSGLRAPLTREEWEESSEKTLTRTQGVRS